MEPDLTRPVLEFSSSSSEDDERLVNYPISSLNSNHLLNSSHLKKPIKNPIPTPRTKHLMNNSKNAFARNVQSNQHQSNSVHSNAPHPTANHPTANYSIANHPNANHPNAYHPNAFNQRNLIKHLNQQQVSDATLTPKLLPKQLFFDRPSFVRTGSLDRKLAEVRKLNFSEMKLRLKQQQQQIEQGLLRKNLIKMAEKDDKPGNGLEESDSNKRTNETALRKDAVSKDKVENDEENDYMNETRLKENCFNLTDKSNDEKNQNLNGNLNKSLLLNKPPTPPQHKGPVWESKFYKLALNSINQVTSESSRSRYSSNQEDHWYLSGQHRPATEDMKSDFLPIDRLPLYKHLNHTIVRIDNLGEVEPKQATDATDAAAAGVQQRISQEPNDHEFNDYDLPPDAYKANRSLNRSFNNKTSVSSFYSATPSASIVGEDDQQSSYFNKNDQLRQSKFLERQVEPVEKSGYLLCNRKSKWKQLYFVLKNGCILFYKTQTDVKKNKLKGSIRLSKDVNVIRNENSSSFQIVDNNKSSAPLLYSLTADSVLTMEEWVRVIKNSLKHVNEPKAKCKNSDLEGWVIRRKNGYSKRFWLVLQKKQLAFHKQEPSGDDQHPAACLDLNDYKVLESLLESNQSRNSLSITNDLLGESKREFVISLESHNPQTAESIPIYLVLSDKKSFSNWLYHLTISTIENVPSLTEFEKIVYKLMSVPVQPNDDPGELDASPLWNEPLLCHSKEPLNQPLTSLETLALKNEALKLFKSIQLFIMVKINVTSGIEYHVALAQSAFEVCFEHPPLQKELFCQLVKQSSIQRSGGAHLASGHLASTSGGTQSTGQSQSLTQSFQLLSLAVSIFEAKGKTLWLLKNFLRRAASDESEPGKYAIYCQRTLERCLTNGSREVKPSRLEVLAILIRNPYHHSLPFSIPVYFSNENYIVVSFDGLSTVEEFCKQICEQSDMRPIGQSGYGLYSDDPVDAGKVHFLPWKCKLGDVVSRWEQSLKNNNLGKFESKRVIKLIFKKRLFFRSNTKSESEKEKMLFVYQLHQDLLNGRIPVASRELTLHLAALLVLFESRTGSLDDEALRKGIDRFCPKNEEQDFGGLLRSMRLLIDQMGSLTKRDCIRIYLNCIKRWPIFGCTLFEATALNGNKRRVYLTVDEMYFYLLDVDLRIVSNYFLNKFLKFGHREDRLIIYLFNRLDCGSNSSSREVTRTSLNRADGQFAKRNSSSNSFSGGAGERLEFQMDKDKINDLILLIADYLNAENGIKFERLTSESNSFATNHTSPFEFSPTNELPASSLYDIKQFSSKNRSSNSSNNPMTLKEDQEYSEIYSPSYENNDFSSSFSSNAQHAPVANLPPTLPLHRCSTWEKTLYELCTSNFNRFISDAHDDQPPFGVIDREPDDECVQQNQIGQANADLNQLKQRSSIGSMISGEYYTNQFSRGLPNDLSNEFSSLDISQYSLSKNSLSKKSSMSRCNSDNSSNGFLNEENLTLKDSLLVLSKKLKWKKRIVLIRNHTIYWFKNEHDLGKGRSKGKFRLSSKASMEEEEKCLRLVDASQTPIAISSDNPIKLKQLAVVILSLFEKLNFRDFEHLDSTIEGWISVIQNGICTRKWCKLKDKVLFFYPESTEEKASLVLSLTDHNVEEAESNDYEFVDWTSNFNVERKNEFSIAIEPDGGTGCKSESIHLVFNEKKDFDVWFYHLSIAGNKVLGDKLDKPHDRSSQFEQIISKLMKIEYEDGLIALESSYLWSEPAICSVSESISHPLTTLKSGTLSGEAIKLYKSIYLFASVEIKSHAIDYHVALAQGSIEMCLDYGELQNEFYCQIIKLSNFANNSNKLMRAVDQSNGARSLNYAGQENHLCLQALQLLSIAVSIFIPKGKVLWFVKHFLRRQSDEHSNLGQYAIYCTKALERSMQTGNREFKPSRMEILGILLRNPNQHSSPHSIPVHFLNGDYLVVGFDGSTTINEFGDQIRRAAELTCLRKSEYALYCDNPIVENHEHYLQANLKLADIISQWEQCLRKKLGRFENNRVLKLTFKKRQFFRKKLDNDKDSSRMEVHRICDALQRGQFPVNHDLAVQFVALLAQSEYGNLENQPYNQIDKLIESVLTKFYPAALKSKVHSVFLVHDLKAKWTEIRAATAADCVRVLCGCAKKWPLFGSTLFRAHSTAPIKVELTLAEYILPAGTTLWLAIDESHFSILDFHNYQQIYQFKLKNLVKFGGRNENKFVLVVKRCLDEFDLVANHRFSLSRDINYDHFLFTMERSQIYELTLLIRDYLLAQSSTP